MTTPTTVPAVGARRRLQALAYLGHGIPTLATWCHRDPDYIENVIAGRTSEVDQHFHDRLAALFDHRGPDDPLPRCLTLGHDRDIARRARTARWHSVMSWWDADIDDPHARPDRGYRRVPSPQAFDEITVEMILDGGITIPTGSKGGAARDLAEAIHRLDHRGVPVVRICERFGCNDRLVHRVRERRTARQKELVAS
jgi:hypothetical protein